jgi:hypothetical protein
MNTAGNITRFEGAFVVTRLRFFMDILQLTM